MECNWVHRNTRFGASAAAAVLMSVLIGQLLDDLFISLILDSRWIESLSVLGNKSAAELSATKRAIGSLSGPLLSFCITIAVLKAYLPSRPVGSLLKEFGLVRCKAQVLFAALVAGIALVLMFRYVLAVFFPPPDFAAPHPANIVNSGSNVDKIVFVFGAVVIAPIAEEFLFRGVLYDGITATLNKWLASVLVTLCFVLVHPEVISSGYWLTHALLYSTACILMLIRELTGALPAGVMFHSGVNFAALLL